MASRSKTRTTFAKLDRERKVLEKRIEKDRRKARRKEEAAQEAATKLDSASERDQGVE